MINPFRAIPAVLERDHLRAQCRRHRYLHSSAADDKHFNAFLNRPQSDWIGGFNNITFSVHTLPGHSDYMFLKKGRRPK
jgi:hypothetical protein